MTVTTLKTKDPKDNKGYTATDEAYQIVITVRGDQETVKDAIQTIVEDDYIKPEFITYYEVTIR